MLNRLGVSKKDIGWLHTDMYVVFSPHASMADITNVFWFRKLFNAMVHFVPSTWSILQIWPTLWRLDLVAVNCENKKRSSQKSPPLLNWLAILLTLYNLSKETPIFSKSCQLVVECLRVITKLFLFNLFVFIYSLHAVKNCLSLFKN